MLHHGADLFESRVASAEYLLPHIAVTGQAKSRLDPGYATYVVNNLLVFMFLTSAF